MNKKPKVMFSNFKNNWKIFSFSNLANVFQSGGTPSTKVINYWNGKIPWLQSSDIQKDILFGVKPQKFISEEGLQNSSAKLISKNSIAIVTRVGVGKLAIMEQDYATSQDFLSLSDFNGDTQFIVYSIYRMLQKESTQLQGTSIKGITKEDLLSKKISLPEIDEQSAIGSLFRTLDDLLSSYKDNLANYQSLKATMLSKMFPKAGQTVPEIRLDGFKSEWELLEINDLADDFQSGGTPKTNVQEYWNGDIPWIQSSDLETNCLFEIKVQKSISEKGLKNSSAKIIPKDSIAVVTRVGVGKLVVMRHEYATSQDFLSLSNLKSNIEFTAYLLYRLLQKEVTQLQGTSIKGITKVELLSKKVLIPSLLEQQAIGTYFTNLDNLISAHQEKISQLETFKKKLLQDMFI
ncbi:restriction endonuclease subunit S [Streptococcus sp. HMSC10E12]|uniref:restriction endonuclease subunit S n=1 Tax=Streptococcus sp. HMSC10E12 TaxID=1581080 RepID=UPI0008A19958|nr:restriction endonuclease subunit S [Streptococcus sp. HMSC10E12]